ncbi:MAG: DUF5320 domain-containing protein [Candidatus Fermentibacteria bacterium]|nr:DUF5320 domain-containing protein [Candidatus Fermentibacteria bacterium]
MPRGDRSGPDGRGPIGGVCVGAGLSRFSGFGGGRGFGRGAGRGFGRGAGLGFNRGYPGVYPVNQETERELLESRTLELERELAILKSRLEKDSEKSES